MVSRYLRIAILVSLGAHIIVMSAVTIITPGDATRMKPYTRVDFLGPILQKTAFDIMLENVSPAVKAAYGYTVLGPQSGYLKVVASKRQADLQVFPDYLERNMDGRVIDFLKGDKVIPDVGLGFMQDDLVLRGWKSGIMEEPGARRVLYRPAAPFIMPGLYGDKESFTVRVTALVGRDGKVKKAEVLATTGYPQLDMTASKHVMGWIFEPKEGLAAGGDEWCDVEVVLEAGN